MAQFLSEGELEKFRHEQRGYRLNIGKEKRSEIERFYMLRHAPRGQSGSDLAKRFLQQYVGACKPAYRDRKTVEHLWSFRNPHAHQFYPFIGKEVRGRVEWLYRDRDGRIGIGISDLEEELADPDRAKALNVDRHLAVIDGWFISIPQILFIDFKVGVQAYEAAVREKERVGRTFVQNYQRLRTFYEFEDL